MAAADADESHSRLPKQNTGGSDALWLGALPVHGKPWHRWLLGDHPSRLRQNQIFGGDYCFLLLLTGLTFFFKVRWGKGEYVLGY